MAAGTGAARPSRPAAAVTRLRVFGVFDPRGRADRLDALFAPMRRRVERPGWVSAAFDGREAATDPAARVLRLGVCAPEREGVAPAALIRRTGGRLVAGAARLYGGGGAPGPEGADAADLDRLAAAAAAGAFARERVGASPLEGDFAAAICDPAGPSLLLVRDAIGLGAMHYRRGADGAVAFATWIHALRALPDVDGAPDPERLGAFVTLRFLAEGTTLWPGLRETPKATALRFGAEGVEAVRYWRPGPDPALRGLDEAEALEAAAERLRAAVLARRDRLGGDPALMFSGGLDSSLVGGALCEAAPARPLAAYTSVSDRGRFPTERAAQLAFAARWPALRMTELGAAGLDALDGADDCWEAHAAPNVDLTYFNTAALSRRMAADGAAAALSGFGGDYVVSAALRGKLAEDLNRLRLAGARDAWRALRFQGLGRRGILRSHVLEALTGSARLRARRGDALALRRAPGAGWAAARLPSWRAAGLAPEDVWPRRVLDEETAALEGMPLWMRPDYLASKLPGGASAGIAHGMPLLDTRLLAAVMAAPARLKTRGGRHRALARALLAPVAPPEVALRPDKAPFQPDMALLLREAALRARADFPEMAERPLWRELVETGTLNARLEAVERLRPEQTSPAVLGAVGPVLAAWFLGAFLRRLEDDG